MIRLITRLALAIGAGIIGAGIIFLARHSRWMTESPPYSVVEAEGLFEVREYPGLTLVTTSMAPDDDDGGVSFGRLGRYLFGKNETSQQIAMTTPVFVADRPGAMSFIVPRAVADAGPPKPESPDVRLAEQAGGKFAVYRVDASGRQMRRGDAADTLMEWARARGLSIDGEPFFAYYDPPWTPSFLRRNEVMVRLKSLAPDRN